MLGFRHLRCLAWIGSKNVKGKQQFECHTLWFLLKATRMPVHTAHSTQLLKLWTYLGPRTTPSNTLETYFWLYSCNDFPFLADSKVYFSEPCSPDMSLNIFCHADFVKAKAKCVKELVSGYSYDTSWFQPIWINTFGVEQSFFWHFTFFLRNVGLVMRDRSQEKSNKEGLESIEGERATWTWSHLCWSSQNFSQN